MARKGSRRNGHNYRRYVSYLLLTNVNFFYVLLYVIRPKRYDSMETNTAKKQADFKRKQLQKLLEKPVFPKGVNVKFPLSNEYLYNSLNKDQINEAAIDVMKNALEKDGKQKNKTIPLYKAKKVSEKNIQHDRVIKLTKFKKDKHKIKNKSRRKGKK